MTNPEHPNTAPAALDSAKEARRQRMREIGALGAKARRKVVVLDLATVVQELGALETPADAMRRLARLSEWAAAGLLRPGTANAAVASVRAWLDAHGQHLAAERVRTLERELRRVQAELEAERKSAGTRRGQP